MSGFGDAFRAEEVLFDERIFHTVLSDVLVIVKIIRFVSKYGHNYETKIFQRKVTDRLVVDWSKYLFLLLIVLI